MTTNIEQKYKDRKPEETIQIIRDYFESLGFEIEIKNLKQSEVGTWWCRIYLKLDNYIAYAQNGKGTTANYALASGYAELFERYTNNLGKQLSRGIGSFNQYVPSNNLETASKALDQITEEYSPRLFYYINNIGKNNFLQRMQYQQESLKEMQYYNVFDHNDIKYFVNKILKAATGSSGMAAGNTLEEALIQGISEIFEHYIRDDFYSLKENTTYYIINLDNLQISEYLSNLIQSLYSNSFQLYLFDFSYTYQVPVLGLYAIDTIKNVGYFQLGSAPVFDIALERLITELYQGREILRESSIKNFMVPAKEIDLDVVAIKGYETTVRQNIYPEYFFINAKYVDRFNEKCFLINKEYTNKEMLNFYQKIVKNLNWELYFYNASPISNFYSVHIFLNNIITHYHYSNLVAKTNVLLCPLYTQAFSLIIKHFQTKTVLKEDFNLIQKIESLSPDLFYYHAIIFGMAADGTPFGWDNNSPSWIDFLTLFASKENCINKANKILEQLSNNPFGMKWRDIVAKYIFLFLYKDSYSKEEIEKLAAIYGHDIQEEDYEIVQHQHLLFQKTCIEPMIEFSNNEWFDKLDKINKGALQK